MSLILLPPSFKPAAAGSCQIKLKLAQNLLVPNGIYNTSSDKPIKKQQKKTIKTPE
jgi:hypothetical protein